MLTVQVVEQFQKMMDEDKAGDGKSVNWDGSAAQVVEDTKDSLDASDGRGGFSAWKTVKNEKWQLKLRDVKYDADMEDPAHSRFEGDGWYLEIRQVDYDESMKDLTEDPNMKEVSEQLQSAILDYNERAALYRGLADDGSQIMAGYTVLIEDLFENEYRLDYYGIGNMSAIQSNALTVFQSFEVE